MFKSHEIADEHVAMAFVGCVVPDAARYHNEAFSRAGNLFQQNLIAAISNAGINPSMLLSVRPVPSFPRSRTLWCGSGTDVLASGQTVSFVPFLNITPLKQLMVSVFALFRLICWALSNLTRDRVICCYNLSVPNGWMIWLAGRLTGTRICACLADINIPGETIPNKLPHRVDYQLQRLVIPRLDGHLTIASEIMEQFAPGCHYLRVVGGVTADVIGCGQAGRSVGANSQKFTIAFVGALTESNGVGLLIDALKRLSDPAVRVVIAGSGPLLPEVRELAKSDSRVAYLGYLSYEEIMRVYSAADLLLNLRLTKAVNTRFLFPSKLMECLASGVPVLSTAIGPMKDELADLVYLLADESPEGLVGLITSIVGQEPASRQAIASKAQNFMEANLTWNAQGERIKSYILEAVLRPQAA